MDNVHDAGTALLVVSGVLYYWFQTIISYHTVTLGLITKCIFVFRLAVSCVLTLSGMLYPFFKWYSNTLFKGSHSPIKVANWKPKHGGYSIHVIDSAEEWIACLSLAIYAVSFFKEFEAFSVEVCCVENKGTSETDGGGDYSLINQGKETGDEEWMKCITKIQ